MSAIGTAVQTKCCYCGMVKTAGQWHVPVNGGEELCSHGCCPVCEAQMMQDPESHGASGPARMGLGTHSYRSIHMRRPIRAVLADTAV